MTEGYTLVDVIIKNYEPIRKQFPSSLHDDAKNTLTLLFRRVHVGILTASSRDIVAQDLHIINMPAEKFFYIQTSDVTSVHKPNPAVFDPILKKLNEISITKDGVIYVGDSINDFFAARDAGLSFYAIAGRTTEEKEFIKHGAKVLGNLTELLEIIH